MSIDGYCWAQVIITEDVNLRSIAAGEGVMAVAGPSELPKKRKDFLPKMFPSLPEDSAVSSQELSSLQSAESDHSTWHVACTTKDSHAGTCCLMTMLCCAACAGNADGGEAGQVCGEPRAGCAEAGAEHCTSPQTRPLPARGALDALLQRCSGSLEVSLTPTPTMPSAWLARVFMIDWLTLTN